MIRYFRAREPAVADDLAGEVWVAVARSLCLGRFVGDEVAFRAWLFTIARCRVIDHRRRAARHRTDPLLDDDMDRPAETSDGRDLAGSVVDRIRAQEAIERIVSDLTDDQAEAVLLRVVADLDVHEVARIMGRTPGSVRVLCHRALRRLAARMSEGVLAE